MRKVKFLLSLISYYYLESIGSANHQEFGWPRRQWQSIKKLIIGQQVDLMLWSLVASFLYCAEASTAPAIEGLSSPSIIKFTASAKCTQASFLPLLAKLAGPLTPSLSNCVERACQSSSSLPRVSLPQSDFLAIHLVGTNCKPLSKPSMGGCL